MATATTTSAPWQEQQPYLQDIFRQAQTQFKTGGPKVYPKSTVAPFSAATNAGLTEIRRTAQAGTPVAASAQNQVNATLQGDYLNSNPYLDAMYNNAATQVTDQYQNAVAPSIQSNFGLAGRSGNNAAYGTAMGMSQDMLGRSLSGLASDIYGGNYANERQNQMQAASMAPQTAQLNYYDASQLLNAGGVQDTYNQNRLNDQVNRFNQQQERPWDALGRYSQLVNGSYGSTNTQPQYGSSLGTNLGLGAASIGGLNELRGIGGVRGIDDWLKGLWGP